MMYVIHLCHSCTINLTDLVLEQGRRESTYFFIHSEEDETTIIKKKI